jgi:hypothetical protein
VVQCFKEVFHALGPRAKFTFDAFLDGLVVLRVALKYGSPPIHVIEKDVIEK